MTEADKPYTYTYHLKVPGYAQKTGSRIFLQPSVLQRGVEAEFTGQQRTQPVFFDYAWRELDQFVIHLPPGYELESPDSPADIQFGKIGGCTVSLRHAVDSSRIEFVRDFFFGGEEKLWFPPDLYPQLKRFFDEVNKADGHMLTLRKSAAGGQPRP